MSRYWNKESEEPNVWPMVRDSCLAFVVLIALSMWGCPQYNVWQQGLAGQAELKRAEQNRQIAIQEALAKKESAQKLIEQLQKAPPESEVWVCAEGDYLDITGAEHDPFGLNDAETIIFLGA